MFALQGDVMLALFYVHNTSGRIGNVLMFQMLLPARWAEAKEDTCSYITTYHRRNTSAYIPSKDYKLKTTLNVFEYVYYNLATKF